MDIAVIFSLYEDSYLFKRFFAWAEEVSKDNCSFHFIHHSQKTLNNTIDFPGKYIHLVDYKDVVLYLEENEIDIVHSYIGDKVTFLARAAGVKRIIQHPISSYTELGVDSYPADCICCSDESMIGQLKKQCPQKHIVSIKDSINIEPDHKPQDLRDKLGFKSGEIVIGFVGKLWRQKYFDKFISMFLELCKKNKKLKLVLDGRTYNKQFEDYLNSRVESIYFHDDPDELIANSDILVIKSETYFNPYEIGRASCRERV